MSELLSRNLAALSAHQSVPIDELLAPKARTRVEWYGPVPVLEAARGDTWIPLNSRRDPHAEVRLWFERALADGVPDTVILVGTGIGYSIEVLEERRPGTRVLAVEPNAETARALLESRDWTPLIDAGRFRVLFGPAYSGIDGLVELFGDAAPPVLVNPAMAHVFADEMVAAEQAAARAIYAARANRAARLATAGRYLTNTLRNAAAIADEADVAALAGLFAGTPAVVISAGPSLDRSLAQLKTVAGKALLVAVDTALRPLLAAGIVPHLVVSLDPTRANADHLLDLPDTSSVHLIAEGSVNPVSLAAFRGRSFVFRVANHHPWPWLASLGCDRRLLQVWGSVATAALDVARLAGCDPVVFCGQDLAYTDGRSYCSGTTWDATATPAGRRAEIDALDIHGHQTTTATHLLSFRDWLVEQSVRDAGRRYINSSAGGVLYGGRIAVMPLDDALGEEPSRPVQDVHARLRAAHTSTPSCRERVETAIASLAATDRSATPEPLASWLSFSGPATTLPSIRRAIGCADDHVPARSPSAADRALTAFAGLQIPPSRYGLARAEQVRLCHLVATQRCRRTLVLNVHNGLPVLLAGAGAGAAEIIAASLVGEDLDGIAASTTTALAAASLDATVSWTTEQDDSSYDLVVLNLVDVVPPQPAIEDQVAAAMARLGPGGSLIVADWTNRTLGGEAQHALMRCLERDPALARSCIVSGSWLSRLTVVHHAPATSGDGTRPRTALAVARNEAASLAQVVMQRLRPSTVGAVGPSAPEWLHPFRSWNGVRVKEDGPCDVLLAIGVLGGDEVDEDRLLRHWTSLSDVIVLDPSTPWLERRPARTHRPMASWAERLLQLDYVLSDDLRALVVDRPDLIERIPNFYHLHVARRITPQAAAALRDSAELRSLVIGGAARIDELFLDRERLRLEHMTGGGRGSSFTTPSIEIVMNADDFEPAGGHCYAVRFAAGPLRLCQRAGLLRPSTIEEDGTTLPIADVIAADVQMLGEGRYCIRADAVYFSSSDNSDPRSNGRRYAMRVPVDVARLAGLA